MNDSHPLHKHLSKLPLFNMYTGVGNHERITMGCEAKHVFKHVRERLKSVEGRTLGDIQISGDLLKQIFLSIGIDDKSVSSMFATGFADAMHVPSMVNVTPTPRNYVTTHISVQYPQYVLARTVIP
jgi:hypothetical protein